MTEQKAKTATKKVTAARGASAVASKPVTAKTGVATTAKKPVVKKPTAKNTVAVLAKPEKAKSPAVKKVAIPATKKAAEAKDKPVATQQSVVKPNPEILYRMVETAAYFIAEQHGFKGHSHDYWLAAEREIAAKLDLLC